MDVALLRKWLPVFFLGLAVILSVIYFLDRSLFFGLVLVFSLTAVTFFIFYKFGIKKRALYVLFLIALAIHMAMVVFSYYTNFQPFGPGDFVWYHQLASQVAERLHQGIFSFEGIKIPHVYPVLIGTIYALTLPQVIIGNLFSAWLSAVSAALAFLIVREMSASRYWPFLIGLMVAVMPSYLFFGSLLLKDTLIIPLVLLGILFSLKICKRFSWLQFAVFFVVLTSLTHLRFYMGFALLFSFIVSWFFISHLKGVAKIGYGLVIIALLGFSPQLLGYGYYGATPLKNYLNEKTITTYREVIYAPNPKPALPTAVDEPGSGDSQSGEYCKECTLEDAGVGSSFVVDSGFGNPVTFFMNYSISFAYSLLGPFPWQIKHARQLFSLLETIPWYFVVVVFIFGFMKSLTSLGFLQTMRHYRFAAPLFLYAVISLGALSLFISNFGIITRIRIPSLIVLLCLISLDPWLSSVLKKVIDALQIAYEKKFTQSHRLPFLQGNPGKHSS